MKCSECRGACCESVLVPLPPPAPDRARWLALRGIGLVAGFHEFPVRCTALTDAGRCGIYEDRPVLCRVYEPGGADCLQTVQLRRTPDDYQRIRDVTDPPTLPPLQT